MIRLADPAKLGEAIAEIRQLTRLSRRDLAQAVAHATGQTVVAVAMQLRRWEDGHTRSPDLTVVGPVLTELGYDLALVPLEDA